MQAPRQNQRLEVLATHLSRAAATPCADGSSEPVKVLVLGGLGTVGSGLRSYLPVCSSLSFEFTSVDLPGAEDKAPLNGAGKDLQGSKYYGDILHEPELLVSLRPPSPAAFRVVEPRPMQTRACQPTSIGCSVLTAARRPCRRNWSPGWTW